MERAVELARERRRPFLAWLALNMAGQLSWGLGDPDGAQAMFERALAVPHIERTAYRQTVADGIGRCHLSRGELDDSRRLLADAKPAWFSHSLKPLVDIEDGRWREAEELADEVLETSRRTGNRWDEWAARFVAARALAMRGEAAAAADLLERSLEIVVAGGARYFELWIRPALARALAETGRLEEASEHVRRSREIVAGGEDWRGRRGGIAVADGIVLARGGMLDEAAAAFADGLDAMERYGLRCERADAMHQWGRALASAGDRTAAAEKLDAALELYTGIGAGGPLLDRVERDRRG
jgi:tetratricopeptide (TPR) repeat protein